MQDSIDVLPPDTPAPAPTCSPETGGQGQEQEAGQTALPVSRRTFVTASLAASVALALPPAVSEAQSFANGTSDEASSKVLSSAASVTISVTLNVNGTRHRLNLEPRTSLLDALREDIGLTGTKKGCNAGACGACTVLVGGRRINSCLTLAAMHEGENITTIEGLARSEQLHPVQAAFIECDGFQCGYCTSGQVMSAVACIQEGHTGSDEEIREWMSGNICRCGAYPGIVAAVKMASGKSPTNKNATQRRTA
jgi:xanthine dehydrogenase YagT iron-sulfur-binding subunit